MNKLLFALAFSLFLLPSIASAATINVTSCSQADVQAAINATQSGDTVLVPAGSCTWNSQLVITKGIYFIGAGIGSTTITAGFTGPYLITYIPANPALNEPFRISGFTFDVDSRTGWIYIGNPTINALTKIRLDHNKIDNENDSYGCQIFGTIYGVIDNNTFGANSQWRFYGVNADSWNNLTAPYGSADNMYFEDNTVTCDDQWALGSAGGRYVVRYNTFTATASIFALFDMHGNMGPGNFHSTMVAEAYENVIDGGSYMIELYYLRGGKALVYDNAVTTTNTAYGQVDEEHDDSLNPPAINPVTGQPQHISDSYIFNNYKNGNTLIGPTTVSGQIDYGGPLGPCPTHNQDYWQQGASFDGSSGVGVGLLSARPTTCTVGVGYWATDESKLYRCTATNTWTLYYTPYTYPHPLRTDCVNYPKLCDSSAATINAASCSYADVQAAVNTANDGDTVLVPSGNCTWLSTLNINKSIVLAGAGINFTTITNGGINPLIKVQMTEDKPVRITGFYFDNVNWTALDYSNMKSAIHVFGWTPVFYDLRKLSPLTKLRIDNCKFNRGKTQIWIVGYVYGVVDHCSFIDGDIAIRRMGDNDASWLRPIVAGTLNSLIIEDNSFLINSNFGAGVYETCGSVNQQIYHDSYGARTTIRNNNFDYSACPYYNDAHIEAHGNWDVTRGSPLIEVYNNILHLNRGYRFMHFRGGSIIIFNNTMIYDYGSRPAAIGLTDENDWQTLFFNPLDTTWPAQDQIFNSFFWDNTLTLNGQPAQPVTESDVWLWDVNDPPFIQKNRDYWMHAPEATGGRTVWIDPSRPGADDNEVFVQGPNAYYPYTPYVYPHPLTIAPFGTVICDEGAISSSCWCEGMKSTGYCCHGYYQTTSCGGVAQPVAGDINGNGIVDINDLALIGTHFGRTNMHPQWNVTADVVANNEVDIYDVVYVASRFT